MSRSKPLNGRVFTHETRIGRIKENQQPHFMTPRPQLLGDFVGHDSSGTVSAKIIRASGLRAQNCFDVIGGVFEQIIGSRVSERVVGNRTQDRTFWNEIWAKV